MDGKKSFVLYTDLLELIEELTDSQAGLLFKTILRYVNDLDPEIPQEIKLAFIPIKQDLKRDLKKYNAQVERINRINYERKRKREEQSRNDIVTTSYEVEGVNVNDNVNVNVNDNVLSKDNDIYIPQSATEDVPNKPKKHKYGSYGWVQLTDEQYNKLVTEFTKDKIDTYINALDEYVQSTGNKNKYKDWNLVLRKAIRGNWFKLETNSQEVKVGNKNVKVKNYQHASDEIVWDKL